MAGKKKTTTKPRSGGRAKGTPNKASAATKDILLDLINEYQDSELLKEDFTMLQPKERLGIFVKILPYIRPKLASVEHNITGQSRKTIDEALREMSGEQD